MKLKVLIFDTETTGLPVKWIPAEEDLTNYPNLLQFAAKLIEVDLDKIQEDNYGVTKELYYIDSLVQPVRKGIEVITHPDALKVHEITHEKAYDGNIIETVALIFSGLIYAADVIVCHNVSFDRNVMMSEVLNLNLNVGLRKNTKIVCTMKHSVNMLKLPLNFPKKGQQYKYPRLEELYQYLFNESMHDKYKAHDAMGDVGATTECFLELLQTDKDLETFLRKE
jgi:DNA polymerase III epsilon subunit-like protein